MATSKAAERLRKIAQEVEKGLATNRDLNFILTEIPNQIEKRTRLGKGVDDNGSLFKLPALDDKYVDRRKKASLSPDTTPKRSNLTFTGKLLSAIVGVRRGTLFTFTFTENRGDGVSNNDLSKWQAEKGRRFFDLSSTERVGLSRKISKIIKESIKKLFDK